MARTKASVGAKLTSGKSSKAVKTSGSTSHRNTTSTPSTSKGSGGSGNSYHPRPTPKWQKPITSFFGEPSDATHSDSEDLATSSMKGRARHSRQITSDTESDEGEELNASVASNTDLPPLSPDVNSHKIVEYFETTKSQVPEASHSSKGKGKGKRLIEANPSDSSTDVNNVIPSNIANHQGELENRNSAECENKENTSDCNVMLEIKEKDVNSKSDKRKSDDDEMTSAKRMKLTV